jgi:hypothetical protein
MLRETLSSHLYGRSVSCTLDVLVLEGIILAPASEDLPIIPSF